MNAVDLSLWTDGELYLYSTVSPFGDPSGWVRARPGAEWWGVIEGSDSFTLTRMRALVLNDDGWATLGNHFVARNKIAWHAMRLHFESQAERERERLDRERQSRWASPFGPSLYPDVDECRLMMQRYHPDRPEGDREKFEKWRHLLELAKEAVQERQGSRIDRGT
jgi:hypothetical protein